MFVTYLWNEIRRRRKQTIVVALGLALGIGLVVTVSAMAAGVEDAQGTVLSSLYGVGTDATVTQTANAADGGDGGPFTIGRGGDQGFSRDQIFPNPGQDTFSDSRVDRIESLGGVETAAGGLTLNAVHLKGKLPEFPDPNTQPSADAPGTVEVTGPDEARINVDNYALVGVDTSNTEVGPLSPSQLTRGRAFTAADADAKVAIVDQSYAADQRLRVGDDVKIDDTAYEVVGIATGRTGGEGSDVYIPLERAQQLADTEGQINTIYVQATSSNRVDAVSAEIERMLPDATVTTAEDLASQVSGSLSSASNLLSSLGRWLSIVVISAAVVLASLLTISSVGRRTRELGTLKAIGWRTRRVVGQVMGESLVQGIIGGVLGVALGLLGAFAVTQLSPSLTATVSSLGGGTSGRGAVFAGPPGAAGGGDPFSTTIDVVLHAPVSAAVVAAAIGLAVLAGVIAGSFGGWRAARLRPADAMRQVV